MLARSLLVLVFYFYVIAECIQEIRRSDRRLASWVGPKLAACDEDDGSPYTAESGEIRCASDFCAGCQLEDVCCAGCARVEGISRDEQPA